MVPYLDQHTGEHDGEHQSTLFIKRTFWAEKIIKKGFNVIKFNNYDYVELRIMGWCANEDDMFTRFDMEGRTNK